MSQSTSKALAVRISQIDRTLEEITYYLLRQIVTPDSQFAYLAMAALPETSLVNFVHRAFWLYCRGGQASVLTIWLH
ncbi:hypothetical protein [Paenibacillus whitsoniae]|uniref:Uncharacterized protein n=1 Tax=Paenibacillus whitsoniae TaxID=2496558 RepID=A0A430JAS5_9BACL|nr:hypothetical protein [Paenibacillus whitsoniae]RTE08131.1 hypothetical protein EJQ19_18730 [Paenibacillus whitsoniae]